MTATTERFAHDFNGDTYSDAILFNSSTGAYTDWLGQANGALAAGAQSFTTVTTSDWHLAGTGDFNGDGYGDLLWRNDSGYTTEWLGTSTGGFTDNAAHAATGAAGTTWHVQDPFL